MHIPHGKAFLGTKLLEAEEAEAEVSTWPSLEKVRTEFVYPVCAPTLCLIFCKESRSKAMTPGCLVVEHRRPSCLPCNGPLPVTAHERSQIRPGLKRLGEEGWTEK